MSRSVTVLPNILPPPIFLYLIHISLKFPRVFFQFLFLNFDGSPKTSPPRFERPRRIATMSKRPLDSSSNDTSISSKKSHVNEIQSPPQSSTTSFNDLPWEVQERILSYIWHGPNFTAAQQVCHAWRDFITNWGHGAFFHYHCEWHRTSFGNWVSGNSDCFYPDCYKEWKDYDSYKDGPRD